MVRDFHLDVWSPLASVFKVYLWFQPLLLFGLALMPMNWRYYYKTIMLMCSEMEILIIFSFSWLQQRAKFPPRTKVNTNTMDKFERGSATKSDLVSCKLQFTIQTWTEYTKGRRKTDRYPLTLFLYPSYFPKCFVSYVMRRMLS